MIKIVIKYELVVYNEQYQLLFLTSMIDTFLLPLCVYRTALMFCPEKLSILKVWRMI